MKRIIALSTLFACSALGVAPSEEGDAVAPDCLSSTIAYQCCYARMADLNCPEFVCSPLGANPAVWVKTPTLAGKQGWTEYLWDTLPVDDITCSAYAPVFCYDEDEEPCDYADELTEFDCSSNPPPTGIPTNCTG